MNVKIYKAKEDMGKVSGIMHAIERLYTEIEVEEESMENATHFVNLLYALADEIKRVEEDIEELEADGDIVDVIKAARVVNLGK